MRFHIHHKDHLHVFHTDHDDHVHAYLREMPFTCETCEEDSWGKKWEQVLEWKEKVSGEGDSS